MTIHRLVNNFLGGERGSVAARWMAFADHDVPIGWAFSDPEKFKNAQTPDQSAHIDRRLDAHFPAELFQTNPEGRKRLRAVEAVAHAQIAL
ncbi:hypothetical protein N2599_24985 (plasmid) [Rhizobium sullae]|uniref:Uncharacterized protein n=1 Tax=Rhizobium sullae TaxID=50338 RepID=A0ABY5XWS1_RHISU|nr:hypothetical protein [Rhizobium sullae]UWU19082.1 hypothetical protein N2599_24985 [Rhizobium sullae]